MDASEFVSGRRGLVYDGIILEIDHSDPELKAIRKVHKGKKENVQKLQYYSDGRGEENPMVAGSAKTKSVTRWQGNILVSQGKSDQGFVQTEAIERWELSSDGQTLTLTIISKPPQFGPNVIVPSELKRDAQIKRIYRKVN